MSVRRVMVGLLGTLGRLAAGLVSPLAAAAAQPDPATAAQPAAKRGALLVVLDASGSMRRDGADGQTLMASARQAVSGLVGALPDGAPVGLRVYGDRVPNTDETRGCKDTHLVVPVGRLDRGAIKKAVNTTKPKGFTPIGYSLKQAANDLPPEGKRTIVLVSDGKDTCAPPNPCKIAKQLARQGADLKVDGVGLALRDPKAKRQLKCIADATGGTYTDADSADSLAKALRTFSTRAVQRYKTKGTQVHGGPAANNAPTVTPGSYTG
ncbi:MAG: vWA domain-containing protein [Streptosporangiaceae bacterium]